MQVCVSPMTNDVEHLLICELAVCVSLEKCLLKSFAHFRVGLFFVVSFGSTLDILDIDPSLV